jgi:hypothetical protein
MSDYRPKVKLLMLPALRVTKSPQPKNEQDCPRNGAVYELQYLRGELGQLSGINRHFTRHCCLSNVVRLILTKTGCC